MATGSIGRICEPAFVDREASASDALRQTGSQPLKFRNPLIDPFRPCPR
jgi:hypothetical protein